MILFIFCSYFQNIKRTLAVEFKRQLNKSEETINCSHDITWSTRDGFETTLVNSNTSSEHGSEYSNLTALSDDERNCDASSESVKLPSNTAAWIPPVPITDTSFIAIITYVDSDCFVYLHPKRDCKLQYCLLQILLTVIKNKF